MTRYHYTDDVIREVRATSAAARTIIGNPEPYALRPDLYRTAWAVLLAERGSRMDYDAIGPARHRVDRPGATSLSARIQARAAALGLRGPRPLVLKDAAR